MPAQQAASGPLKITVVEGEGGTNNITEKTGARIAVEVRDAAGKPMSGAEVVFQLPSSGPSGVFSDWMLSQTVKTNEQGRAATSGFTPNHKQGVFKVGITATLGSSTGTAEVTQTNVKGKTKGNNLIEGGRSKWWKWAIGVGAVAVVVAIVAATRNSESVVSGR